MLQVTRAGGQEAGKREVSGMGEKPSYHVKNKAATRDRQTGLLYHPLPGLLSGFGQVGECLCKMRVMSLTVIAL